MRHAFFARLLCHRLTIMGLITVGCLTTTLLQAREWADSTGEFRLEAELVAVRGDKVVLEKTNGDIISIPMARLSEADREFLRQHTSGRPAIDPTPDKPFSAAPMDSSSGDDQNELAARTETILRAACYRCHGEDGSSEGGFNFVANLPKLARTFAKPGQPSLLIERITADEDSVMPPVGEQPRLGPSEIETIRQWVDAGAPAASGPAPRAFVSNEQMHELMLADVRSKKERSQRFMRYFTLTHLYNAGLSQDELQTFRNAFIKLINSLSWNRELVVPAPIDEPATIFGVDIRHLHWTDEIWRSIEQANPYFIKASSPAAIACEAATEAEMPHVRIDWFVFAASKPPLYHDVLGLPQSDVELERMLRVNVEANISQEQVIRAAFNRSGVSQNNRLIEWHTSPYGSYWKSYDFGGNTGHQNLFEYPLGPDRSSNSFRHDGGEIVFSLPNGLQGYLLVDERGNRIDQGPTAIVSDPKRPDRAVTNGVSCMSCHYTGVIPKKDEVGVAVRRNRDAFEDADDILALYREPEELDAVFKRDGQRFSEVMERLGIANLSRSGESISAMSLRFQQDIDLVHVASEFGLEREEFLARLSDASTIARVFSPLGIPGGTIKRDVFKDLFADACIDLRLTGGDISGRTVAGSSAARGDMQRSRRGSEFHGVSEVAVFTDLRWGVRSVAIHPGGNLLAGGRPDRSLTIFDVANRSVAASREDLDLLQSITACAFTRDGEILIVGGSSGHVSIFDVDRSGMLKDRGQFAGHAKGITAIAISDDGSRALTASEEKKARLWEIDSGREVALIDGFLGSVKAVHISRDGRLLQATDGGEWKEFDTRSDEVTRSRPVNRSWASGQAAAFSDDGSMLAAGDSYNVRLWELDSGRELSPLVDSEIQWSMVFSPDGSKLFSGGSGKVSVWDVNQQKRLHVQSTGHGYVKAMAVSEDGNVIAVPWANGRELRVFAIE